MNANTASILVALGLLGSTMLASPPAQAAGSTWWVANDGTDSSACGNRIKPCRSISQAIENASDGDTIAVGAGRYGDLSGDGTFSHPGDEHPQAIPFVSADNSIAGCIICITKPLQIVSLHGASVTIIQGVPSLLYPVTIWILSDGVSFGSRGAGFTIMGGNRFGVRIDENSIPRLHPQRISVAGNVDLGDGTAYSLVGSDYSRRNDRCSPQPPPTCVGTPMYRLEDNEAIGNSVGFSFEADLLAGVVAAQNNFTEASGTGFAVDVGTQSADNSATSAGGISLAANVAVDNQLGFATNLAGPLQNNTAIANSQAGFAVTPQSAFTGNSAIGNAGPGIIVDFSADLGDIGLPDDGETLKGFTSFTRNNFYGNDRARPTLNLLIPHDGGGAPGYNPGPAAHCAVLNVGALAAINVNGVGVIPREPLLAPANFWGSAAGPIASGAGDAVGGACDQNGGATSAAPFAAVDFGITTAP